MRIDEVFLPRAQVKVPDKDGFAAWKMGLTQKLREPLFPGISQEIPAAVEKDSPGKLLKWTTEPALRSMRSWAAAAARRQGGTLIVLNRARN